MLPNSSQRHAIHNKMRALESQKFFTKEEQANMISTAPVGIRNAPAKFHLPSYGITFRHMQVITVRELAKNLKFITGQDGVIAKFNFESDYFSSMNPEFLTDLFGLDSQSLLAKAISDDHIRIAISLRITNENRKVCIMKLWFT